MRKSSLALIALLLLPGHAFAGYNMFTGGKIDSGARSELEKSVPVKPVDTPKVMPALPMPLPQPQQSQQPPQVFPSYGGKASDARAEVKTKEKPSWRIIGAVNSQVTLVDNNGRVVFVADGGSRDGCLVNYPEIDCSEQPATAREKDSFKTVKITPASDDSALRFPHPAWYNPSNERAVVVEGVGEIHAIRNSDNSVAMLRAPKARTALLRRELVKYLLDSIVVGDQIFCRTSKLVLEEVK